jgi:hypothetical protein
MQNVTVSHGKVISNCQTKITMMLKLSNGLNSLNLNKVLKLCLIDEVKLYLKIWTFQCTIKMNQVKNLKLKHTTEKTQCVSLTVDYKWKKKDLTNVKGLNTVLLIGRIKRKSEQSLKNLWEYIKNIQHMCH